METASKSAKHIFEEEKTMSEQEKKEAIVAEGTVTEAKDERSWLKKLVDNHPKAWKWAKRSGAGIGIGGSLLMSFEIGKATGARNVEPVKLIDTTETDEENDTMDDDAE
jgi:hypothetical protein